MIALAGEGHHDVRRTHAPGEAQARLPWHVVIAHAMEKPDRAVERDGAPRDEVLAPLIDEATRHDVAPRIVDRGNADHTLAQDHRTLRVGETRPKQILGEVGRGGDADEGGDAMRTRQCREQHDPAAHARADENLRPFRQLVEDGERVALPATDRGVLETSRESPMAEIIEAQEGLAVRPAEGFERQRLGPRHVRHEAAEEDDAGRLARETVVGDCRAVLACYNLMSGSRAGGRRIGIHRTNRDMSIDDADPNKAAPPKEGRPPSVLQVLPALVSGGVERGAVEISAALVAAGWQSFVASAGGKMAREIERHGGHHVTLPLTSKNPLVMRRNVGRLAKIIRAQEIDIIHARSRAPAWSARAAARRTGRHFVTTFHNAYGHGTRLRRWYNSVMGSGERVIAISEFVASHAIATYGLEPQKVRVIQRGVDLARFDPHRVGAERLVDLARQWRLEDGRAVIMLPGRMTRWKGQLDLVAAVAMLGREDIHCIFVGSDEGRGSYRAELERAIIRHDVARICHCVDDCNDMPAALMLADVVVSASTRPEGFGRVIVEAQAMGRPVIATDHGGARETVLTGETGWLVPPGDPHSLAGALAAALALTADERLALAERGITHIRTNFSTARMCEETLAVYEEILFPRLEAREPPS